MKISPNCIILLAASSLKLCSGFGVQKSSNVVHSSTSLNGVHDYLSKLSPISLNGVNGAGHNTVNTTSTRRPILAGNWKLNPTTRKEALELLSSLKATSNDAEVVIFPPLPFLSDAISMLEGTGIKVGAQTASSYENGAFTGEVAPSMLATAGCSYVLLGHSERRTLFGETDASINDRLKACMGEADLKVILCVGETLSEYESGLLNSVVDTQVRKGLAGVSAKDLLDGRVVIAYEPVWAIGTGLVATPDQVCVVLRTSFMSRIIIHI